MSSTQNKLSGPAQEPDIMVLAELDRLGATYEKGRSGNVTCNSL
jgi:hypothetical protein